MDDKSAPTEQCPTTLNGLPTILIPCLENLTTLANRCKSMGLRFTPPSDSSTVTDVSLTNGDLRIKRISNGESKRKSHVKKKAMKSEYEVEYVLDVNDDSGKTFYWVKWKGWSSTFNSWEPIEHLNNCPKLLTAFHQEIRTRLSACLSAENDDELILSGEDSKIVSEYTRKRKIVLEKLREWQDAINRILPNYHNPITIENEVDLEGPPENFTYINDYKAGKGITIPDDPLVGCECETDCYTNQKQCCVTACGSKFAYEKSKTLAVPQGTPIYECNRRCSCGPDCVNRVVQNGTKARLAIFRTSNGCGWGVKTLQDIKKNEFVMEYVGEVISTEEAEIRGKIYDEEGRTYLFDLDFEDKNCLYTVDAAHYGNVSHFMNHSCDPNLVVYGVWINTLDPGLPRLAYFSKRDISCGEELTFDYMMSCGNSSRSPGAKVKKIICKCGSANCKKFLA